jgi:hypothetical protein
MTMSKLTDDEEDALAEFARTDPEAAEIFRECWADMSDEGRERFTRFAERLAGLPPGLKPTQKQLDRMVDSDSDFPLN